MRQIAAAQSRLFLQVMMPFPPVAPCLHAMMTRRPLRAVDVMLRHDGAAHARANSMLTRMRISTTRSNRIMTMCEYVRGLLKE